MKIRDMMVFKKIHLFFLAVSVAGLLFPSGCAWYAPNSKPSATDSHPAAVINVPHITSRAQGWRTVLEMDNISESVASFHASLYDLAGSVVHEFDFVLWPGMSSYMPLDVFAGDPVSAVIKSYSQGLRFRTVYMNKAGGAAEIALPCPEGRCLNLFFTSALGPVDWKGMAIMNTASKPLEITMRAFGDGRNLGTAKVVIPPFSRGSGLVSGYFPGLDQSLVQRVEVRAFENITAMAISGNGDNSRILVLPALP